MERCEASEAERKGNGKLNACMITNSEMYSS